MKRLAWFRESIRHNSIPVCSDTGRPEFQLSSLCCAKKRSWFSSHQSHMSSLYEAPFNPHHPHELLCPALPVIVQILSTAEKTSPHGTRSVPLLQIGRHILRQKQYQRLSEQVEVKHGARVAMANHLQQSPGLSEESAFPALLLCETSILNVVLGWGV